MKSANVTTLSELFLLGRANSRPDFISSYVASFFIIIISIQLWNSRHLPSRMAYDQPQHGGQADSYYQQGQQDIGMQDQNPKQYQAPSGPPPYPPQQQQYPPQQQQYNTPARQDGKQARGQNGGQSFAQSFNIEKPKFNDIWAAILFLLTFAGFVAVSGLAINGYSSSNEGGGIYNSTAQEVGLNANTIILL